MSESGATLVLGRGGVTSIFVNMKCESDSSKTFSIHSGVESENGFHEVVGVVGPPML